LGTRVGDEYQWVTFRDCANIAEHLSYGMMALDLAPDIQAEGKTWKFLGIQSKNRKEWVLTNMANYHQNITTVAFYDTLGPDATKYICNQTELTTMAISQDYVDKLSKLKLEDAKSDSPKMFRLKNLIVFEDNLTEEQRKIAKDADINLYTMEEVIMKGREVAKAGEATINEPKPDDCFMFSYTSGTTGDPKGVKLTHKMVVQCGFAVNTRLGRNTNPFSEDDCYVSYLPAAHSFEQAVFGSALIYGMKCGFFAGNVLKLTDDIACLKPTIFPSVPRLYNRIQGRIKDQFKAATGAKAWLINKAVAAKQYYHKNGQGLHHKLYDTLVFGKVKAILGGQVRCMITGSAPISPEVLDFLKICFCCDIVEGYGMTETCAGSMITHYGDHNSGHVGGPLQNVKVRLRDIPEMNYLSTNDPPKGEVMMWGTSIMPGYFCNPEKTAEALSADGWLASGDVGMVMKNGSIKIVDRAKNIFKLSQGEYIAPEKLENVYVQSSYVAQNWIYGDSLRDHIVGFFVVEPANAGKWAKEHGKEFNEELMKDPEFIQEVYDDLMRLAVENKCNGLEKPKQIHLIKEPWTDQNDYLTPTMKMKRNIAKVKLQKEIDDMYASPLMMDSKTKAAKAAAAK